MQGPGFLHGRLQPDLRQKILGVGDLRLRGLDIIFRSRSGRNTHTLVPLSIACIVSEGRIVDIQDMKPLDDPPSYVSAKPARYALEVNQGFFEERGVKVGDRAELPT